MGRACTLKARHRPNSVHPPAPRAPTSPAAGRRRGQGAACSSRLRVSGRWRAGSGAVQASEDPERRRRVDDHSAHHHAAPTARASEAIDAEDVPEQVAPGPAPAGSHGSPPGAALGEPTPAGFRFGSRGHDLVPPGRAGPEDAVIQDHIGVRRWNQRGQALHQPYGPSLHSGFRPLPLRSRSRSVSRRPVVPSDHGRLNRSTTPPPGASSMRLFARAGRQTYRHSRSTASSSCPPTTTPAWTL